MPEDTEFSAFNVFKGFCAGLLVGFGCFVVSVVVGLSVRYAGVWIFSVLNAVLLILVGALAVRNYSESGIARGMIIGLSVMFLLNAICGIAFR